MSNGDTYMVEKWRKIPKVTQLKQPKQGIRKYYNGCRSKKNNRWCDTNQIQKHCQSRLLANVLPYLSAAPLGSKNRLEKKLLATKWGRCLSNHWFWHGEKNKNEKLYLGRFVVCCQPNQKQQAPIGPQMTLANYILPAKKQQMTLL